MNFLYNKNAPLRNAEARKGSCAYTSAPRERVRKQTFVIYKIVGSAKAQNNPYNVKQFYFDLEILTFFILDQEP